MHVCKDSFSGEDWSYDPATMKYFRKNAEGQITGAVRGKNLPDPFELWKRRAFTAGVTPTGSKGMRMRPQSTTFDLWNHWKTVKEADCIAEETDEARQKG